MKKFLFLCAVVAVVLAVRGRGKSDLQGEWGNVSAQEGATSLTIGKTTLVYAQYRGIATRLFQYHYKREGDALYLSLIKVSEDGGATWERRGGEDGIIAFSLPDKTTLEFDGRTYIKSSALITDDKQFFDGTWRARAYDNPGEYTTITFNGDSFSQIATGDWDIRGVVKRKGSKTTYTVKQYSKDGTTWQKPDEKAMIYSTVIILNKNQFAESVAFGDYGNVAQIYSRVE